MGFSVTEGHGRWLERLVSGRRHCWRRHVAKHCLTCRHTPMREFQCRTVDRSVSARGEVYFGKVFIGG